MSWAAQRFMQQSAAPLEGCVMLGTRALHWRLCPDRLELEFERFSETETGKQAAARAANFALSPKRQKGPENHDRCEGT